MESNQSKVYNCVQWKKSFDPEPVNQVFWSYIFTFVVALFTSVTATFLNALVIIATFQSKRLHTPSNVLLCSLAFSDFVVGFFAQPLYASHIIFEIKGHVQVYCVIGAVTAFVSYTSAGASLFTLAAISVDRCFAIHQPLRYRALVTPDAVVIVTLVLWILGAVGASTRLYLTVTDFMFSLAFVMFVSLVTIFTANLKAFRRLNIQKTIRKQLRQGQEDITLAQSRKYLMTMLFILGLVLLCYVPFASVTVVTALYGVTSNTRAAWNIADTIGYMNSSLNPILYCLRMREIANAVRVILRKYSCRNVQNNQVIPDKPVVQALKRQNKLTTIYEESQISTRKDKEEYLSTTL